MLNELLTKCVFIATAAPVCTRSIFEQDHPPFTRLKGAGKDRFINFGTTSQRYSFPPPIKNLSVWFGVGRRLKCRTVPPRQPNTQWNVRR